MPPPPPEGRIVASYVSYSAIAQYLRCPLQYYFQRVLKLPIDRVASGLVLGGAVHAALANYHLQLQQNEAAGGGEVQTIEVYRALLEEHTRRERQARVVYRQGESRRGLLDEGRGLVETYLAAQPPTKIQRVEEWLWAPLTTSSGHLLSTPLAAVADLVYGDPHQPVVRELKTSRTRYRDDDVDTALQGTCYAHAVEQAVGVRPRLEYAVLIRTKTPQLQLLSTSRRAEQLTRLADLVATVQHAIDAEAFYPIESPFNCSTCPFRAECREWRPVSPQERAMVRQLREEASDDESEPQGIPLTPYRQGHQEATRC